MIKRDDEGRVRIDATGTVTFYDGAYVEIRTGKDPNEFITCPTKYFEVIERPTRGTIISDKTPCPANGAVMVDPVTRRSRVWGTVGVDTEAYWKLNRCMYEGWEIKGFVEL